MSLLVPLDCCVLILVSNAKGVDVILLQHLEKWLVATDSHGPQLVIVPVLSINILHVQIRVAWEVPEVLVGANLAHESAQEHN